MYVTQPTIDGLNIFKAIGRALGGTGRAIVAAIPGVGAPAAALLDTAARQPAKQTAAQAQAVNATVAAAANTAAAVAPPVTPVPGAASNDVNQMLTKLLTDVVASKQPTATAPPPSAPVIVTTPAAQSAIGPVTQAGMPPWAIPAMIGAGLLLVMTQNKR